ncbi:hypothetical protein [Halovivax gelatinilyticus]|uniref:hypothetical protein n=1 Tax=Halovivax gelatinilyticus TaxID=2961597 RepID=UPI0020CA69D7|nr:hypothetical protein [Halovivax gelatinilyticus]
MDRDPRTRTGDVPGFETQGTVFSRGLGKLVPNAVAKRAISVSISTDRDSYDRGEPVPITVSFTNRLPVAVSIPTPTQRRWGWAVDGHTEATTERRYLSRTPAVFPFGAGQTRRVSIEWNGYIRHVGRRDESKLPDPGEVELTAFLATAPASKRPTDSTTITLR